MRSADFFSTHPVFTHEEYLSAHGHGRERSPRTVDSLLGRQVGSKRLLRVRRGLYAVVPGGSSRDDFEPDPFLVAGNLAADAVVAYHAALQFRGKAYSVWHRFPVLTATHMRPFTFRGNEFVAVAPPKPLRDAPDFGGGLVTEPYAGGHVRVTTLERTLVDVLDAPAHGGGWEEVWRSLEMVEYFDLDAVVGYALTFASALTTARLGVFLEQHRERLFVEEQHLAPLRAAAPRQPRYFDSNREAGRLARGWNVVVPERVLSRSWEE
jgi:predicted transcriptional regulator of viral defense system